MEYTTSKPLIHRTKLRHFKNAISLRIKPERLQELADYATACGIGKDGMRVSYVDGLRSFDLIGYAQAAHVSFRNKKRAMLFKLAWTECDNSNIQDMLSRIRTVMPNLIAQSIVGVQPMGGPYTGPTMRVKHSPARPSSSGDNS
jgi:hypothetical protein